MSNTQSPCPSTERTLGARVSRRVSLTVSTWSLLPVRFPEADGFDRLESKAQRMLLYSVSAAREIQLRRLLEHFAIGPDPGASERRVDGGLEGELSQLEG